MEFVDTSVVEQIEMKMIRPSQFSIRDRFQKTSSDVDNLANSIREHGLLQPILIRPLDHGFEIVAGHRRFQACRSLRWRFISCKIRELSDKQAFEIQLTENVQRKSMDPVEEAEAFRKYVIDFGWGGISELARKICKSEEYVSHRLQLLKLPDDIKRQIVQNKINVSQALELTSVPADKRAEIMNHIIGGNLTVRQIREVKSILKDEILESDNYSNSHEKSVRISKKSGLILKIALCRLDNLIDEVHTSIEPEHRIEIINFLMGLRLKVHAMIDDTIRFKNEQIGHKTRY